MICTSVSTLDIIQKVLWCANLNNDITVYRNDKDNEPDSWLQLKEYIQSNDDVYIKSLYFRFRDNYVTIKDNASAFFFTKSISMWYGSNNHQEYFMGGYLTNDNKIHIKKFILPELILKEEEYRHFDDPTIQRGLIWRKNIKANIEQMTK